uniref:Uncharacterized protein n=1 Tax=Oryza brachyantha TaxID=4533 RepID=J3M580_ORYBR
MFFYWHLQQSSNQGVEHIMPNHLVSFIWTPLGKLHKQHNHPMERRSNQIRGSPKFMTFSYATRSTDVMDLVGPWGKTSRRHNAKTQPQNQAISTRDKIITELLLG